MCGVATTKTRQMEYRRDLRTLWSDVGVIYRILGSTCYSDFLFLYSFLRASFIFSFLFFSVLRTIMSSDLLT